MKTRQVCGQLAPDGSGRACERWLDHDGDHRGYHEHIDEPIFWSNRPKTSWQLRAEAAERKLAEAEAQIAQLREERDRLEKTHHAGNVSSGTPYYLHEGQRTPEYDQGDCVVVWYDDLVRLADAKEAAEARLRAVEQERDELVSRLSGWRSWVPFVFGNGGYAHGSDDDLRRQVCERYDAVERAARSVVEQFRAMQRQQYEKLVLGQTLESASDNWPTLGASIDFQPLLDLFPDPPAAPPRT